MKSRLSRYTISDTAIKYISFFESATKSKVKDCLIVQNGRIVQPLAEEMSKNHDQKDDEPERIVFVIEETQAGRAIGKHGENIKRFEQLVKKKVRVIEFNQDVRTFIRNAIYPTEVKEIVSDGKIVQITGNDKISTGHIIGRDGRNLDFLTELVKRYFDIEEIKVSANRAL